MPYDRAQTAFNALIAFVGNSANGEVKGGIITKNVYDNVWYSSTGILVRETGENVIKITNVEIHSNQNYESYFNNGEVGAIAAYNGGKILIDGANIHDNESIVGAVYAGSTISDVNNTRNRVESDGSYIDTVDKPLSEITFRNGAIRNNKKRFSYKLEQDVWKKDVFGTGGVMIFGAGKFTFESGEISGNTAPLTGGAVLAMDAYTTGIDTKNFANTTIEKWSRVYPATFIMTGGTITGNKAESSGGGVYIANNTSEISGGEITDNTAGLQGGGIYVACVPYVLHVKNAHIVTNEANDEYREVTFPIDGINHTVVQGSGGGVWFCPTGTAEFYSEKGVIFESNTALAEADDFKSEAKADGYSVVALPTRTPLGTKIKWMHDYHDSRYTDGESVEQDQLTNIKGYLALKAVYDENNSEDNAKVNGLLIKNNIAQRGGGIGSNGSIIFGENTDSKELVIKKEWVGENTPKLPVEVEVRAKVDLDNDGFEEDWLIEKIQLNAENNFTYTLKELPSTIADTNIEDIIYLNELTEGYFYSYTDIVEDENAMRTETIEAEGKTIEKTIRVFNTTLTNSPKVKVKVSKVWVDDNNASNIRPESIMVTLYKNGNVYDTYEITKESNWELEINDLSKFDDEGNENVYTLKEASVPGYTSEITGNVEEGYTITNTQIPEYKPERTRVEVTKVWVDDNNKENSRPDKITVILLANGKEYQRKEMTSKDSWKLVFDNLPKYDNNGKEIVYTFDEVDVKGYEKRVNGNIITNVYVPEKPNEPQNPNTGDSMKVLTLVAVIAVAIVAFVAISRRKNK